MQASVAGEEPIVSKIKTTGPLEEGTDGFAGALHERLGESPDIVYRNQQWGSLPVLIIYVDGFANPVHVLEALRESHPPASITGLLPSDLPLSQGGVCSLSSIDEAVGALLSGELLLYVGPGSLFGISAKALKQRGIEEPSSQTVVRGPREGFAESLRDNTALIRRRLQNPRLRLEERRIGKETNTQVAMMYMEGSAEEKTVERVRSLLGRIKLDAVLDSSHIEELIQDRKYSMFPTVFNTERPDVAASALLEGRIVILVEGSPFVLVVPALFVHFFQSGEDYYQRSDFSSLVRLLRYFCFVVALLTPSIYIAITTFHQEMIPTTLLMSLIGQREGVPFPAFVEALIMEITFEILREAGIRLPKSIGQSVSIVGTLVIGQAAVDAGIVSAAMVIVVAVTAISNFALPAFNMAISIRLLRFGFMALAASFGLFGIILALITLGLHLCSLHSVGVAYMTPLAPFQLNKQQDALVRLPRLWAKRIAGRKKRAQ